MNLGMLAAVREACVGYDVHGVERWTVMNEGWRGAPPKPGLTGDLEASCHKANINIIPKLKPGSLD